jgi:hypothetical protein
MRSSIAIPLVLATACAPETDIRSGEVALCLANNSGTVLNPSATAEWSNIGTVTAINELDGSTIPGLDCSGSASHAINIEELDGTSWTLAYGITNQEGDHVAPALDLTLGDTVNFMFRQKQTPGTAARGFVVVDGSGLVAAVDNGIFGGALTPGDVEGLNVNRGIDVGDNKEECGLRSGSLIEFSGNTTVSIEPFSSSTLQIGESSFEAYAVSAFFWTKGSCDENTDEFSWAIFR